jgi:hypothetical protein
LFLTSQQIYPRIFYLATLFLATIATSGTWTRAALLLDYMQRAKPGAIAAGSLFVLIKIGGFKNAI